MAANEIGKRTDWGSSASNVGEIRAHHNLLLEAGKGVREHCEKITDAADKMKLIEPLLTSDEQGRLNAIHDDLKPTTNAAMLAAAARGELHSAKSTNIEALRYACSMFQGALGEYSYDPERFDYIIQQAEELESAIPKKVAGLTRSLEAAREGAQFLGEKKDSILEVSKALAQTLSEKQTRDR